MEPTLVHEWGTDTCAVKTLTAFNGHLYSGGYVSKKIQKWNEDGELVQEWETAHSGVSTLTVFNGHLYSGSGWKNKIQKWKIIEIYLFFQIFYKGTAQEYNLETGILEQIYKYIW